MAEPRPRLLFVVSNDFGELANALYLTAGEDFDVRLLLPPRLHGLQAAHLPWPSERYETLPDLESAIERTRPDLVLLFSGYLLGVNGLLDLGALQTLVAHARRLSARVATSDPFLGVFSRADPAAISDAHPHKAALLAQFAGAFTALKDATHVYPADARGLTAAPAAGFFNPEGFRLPSNAPERLTALGLNPERPQWLFVLSAEDYAGEVGRRGQETFDRLLLRLLEDALGQGRQPVLLAPDPCLLRMQPHRPSGATFVGFCPIDTFEALALTAEHAFYWNVFSNSILARLATERSVFFFDPGHMARALRPVATLGIVRYYAGAALPWLEIRQPLRQQDLSAGAALQPARFAPALARLRALPTPQRLVAHILGGPS